MVIASFSIEEKEERSCFFEKAFLLANISVNIALEMPFFTLSKFELNFVDCHIYWRIFIVAEIHLTIRQVELIGKKNL